MKVFLTKLIIISMSLWTISCGQIDLVSTDFSSRVTPSEKVEEAERAVEELVSEHQKLNQKLKKSYSKVVSVVSQASHPFALAKFILSDDINLEKLLEWADELLDNINRVNTPLVNGKADQIRALRNAETDADLRARYDAILVRLEEEHTVSSVNVSSLQRKVQSGMRSTQKALDWMVGGNVGRTFFFLIFGSSIYDKVVDLDVTLNYLDINLERMN